MAVVCVAGVIGGVLFSRGITRRLDEAVQVTSKVAAGDLTARVSVDGRDEIAQLLAALRAMQGQLSQVVTEVRHNAVTQMDQATQQNAALVEESAAAAASLKGQAQRLVDAVAVFRTTA